MNKIRNGSYSIAIISLILFTNPAFAELSSLNVNDELFVKGDQIVFSGIVEKESSGLVTIVVRDQNEQFVLLSQANINHDNTFEKSVIINEQFENNGVYTANGFILNMTKGITAEFVVSSEDAPREINNKSNENPNNYEQSNEYANIKEPEPVVKKYPSYADFVDPSKDPSHYIERYYSETTYKSWFDKNYPNLTIEETVGFTDNIKEIKSKVHEIIPEAQASSMVESVEKSDNNSDIAQISLAVAALGILFGAVYGVKRQVDNNSKQILINKDTIRRKIFHPIVRTNPMNIIQTRLAKGEITLEEFESLRSKLN
ncbi:SHOCT domain-containing protein [Nitrosopumilus oxyclinae]|uniref:SHOCT domain-containing protein n=1 Tax=Nitrosopumilus oxyclinae TaxID=1959104 RepID=UPI001FE7286D|nr:SHOCT domain-containing protein [Nitrosopumilus oxyclinae]